MRRVFQFDGKDGGVFSLGECSEPEQLSLCISSNGNEARMVISQEEWYALVGMCHEIRFKFAEEEDGEKKLKVV